ncbi:leucine dehydrogenase [Bacilli bacterium PM5-3]|nr:leucine dehydrogenase [Bacilli bacterium PM5-3]
MVLDKMIEMSHEQLTYCYDEETGFKAIIAIHSTKLGPALGGTRFYPYENEEDALIDVLRLSKGMSYKNAAANLGLGGGKAVIIGDPKKLKTPTFLKSYAKFVNRLNGSYFTAADMNTNSADMKELQKTTKFAVGIDEKSGSPSPKTALGVLYAIKAGVKYTFGSDDLNGKTIAILGVGSVGKTLAHHLNEAGAKLIVADVYAPALEELKNEINVEVVSVEEIFSVECDVFAPCAMGAIFTEKSVAGLKCKIIAGAANNVLANDKAGDLINERQITYVPDYIANAGGVINIANEVRDMPYDEALVDSEIAKIYETSLNILEMAKEKNIPTYKAADMYAENIINKG